MKREGPAQPQIERLVTVVERITAGQRDPGNDPAMRIGRLRVGLVELVHEAHQVGAPEPSIELSDARAGQQVPKRAIAIEVDAG